MVFSDAGEFRRFWLGWHWIVNVDELHVIVIKNYQKGVYISLVL